MFRFLFTLSLLLFPLSKTQKDQKYFRCFSLFVSLGCYLWFALLAIFSLLFENPKIFCFVRYSFCSCFKNRKPQKYLLLFFGFVKFIAEFSLPLLLWSLVFTLYYSSHTSEEQ
jgi:hypothetical protein